MTGQITQQLQKSWNTIEQTNKHAHTTHRHDIHVCGMSKERLLMVLSNISTAC